jgi:hypothetical protein
LNCNYSIRAENGNVANPQANSKKSIGRRFSLTNNKYSPDLVSFIGQMLPIIWAVRCQFDVLDSSCSSSRAAELTPPKDLTASAILCAGE